MAFLDDYARFEGLIPHNDQGQSLDEFLKNYDVSQYEHPSVTADVVLFGYETNPHDALQHKKLKVLLIKRANHPCLGMWALPGGFVDMREDVYQAAQRELAEETSLRDITLEALGFQGGWQRDPRTRIVTAVYVGLVDLVSVDPRAGDDASEARWFDVSYEPSCETRETMQSSSSRACQSTPGTCSASHKHGEIRRHRQLMLSCPKGQIFLSAQIDAPDTSGFIRSTEFLQTKVQGLAFDHACMIARAYELLAGRL